MCIRDSRVAVQAKLDAADKELRKARDLVQQRTEELGRVRETVRQYTRENEDLHNPLAQANRQIKWVGESCRKHLDTIQVDHDEFVEKLELELDIAEEQIQYHKETARDWRIAAWAVFMGYTVVAAAIYAGTL